MNEIDLENAHRHSFQNRVEIEQSLKCGCFSCGSIFDRIISMMVKRLCVPIVVSILLLVTHLG